MSNTPFSALGLPEKLSRAIEQMGFEHATEIQANTIPLIMEGKDVIGRSQTGSGKTIAFGLPAVACIDPTIAKHLAQVLILCPTRELAMQAADEMRKLTAFSHGIKISELYGGMPMPPQITRLKAGSHIVIGTPGRVMDHLRRRTLKLTHLKMIVLDEADEMLSMGFKEDIETILQDVPEERQTILFSATMPPSIMALTKTYQTDPELVEVGNRQRAVDTITQSYYDIPMGRKVDALTLLLRYYNPKRSMIFSNTKKMVEELAVALTNAGFSAEGLHGDMKQSQRTTVLNAFKSGKSSILVATDVAARGIDVDGIDYVFNFDIPQNTEYYIHRIGRTGRAGKDGIAITLCCGRRQVYQLNDILRQTKSNATKALLPTAKEINEKATNDNFETLLAQLGTPVSEQSQQMAEQLLSCDFEPIQVLASLIEAQYGAQFASMKEIPQDRDMNRRDKRDRQGSGNRASAGKLSINVGRDDRIAPNHIVGAITEKTDLRGKDVGKIEIFDNHSIIAIPADQVESVLKSLEGFKINGKRVTVTAVAVKDGRGRRDDYRGRHKSDRRGGDKRRKDFYSKSKRHHGE